MKSGLERAIDCRTREWKLIIPGSMEVGQVDDYARPIRGTSTFVSFQGLDLPLGESRTGQQDIGHVTRGDRELYVTHNGHADLSQFQVGRELVDVFGIRWGIVTVDNWAGKLLPGQEHDSVFVRMQITRKAMQP